MICYDKINENMSQSTFAALIWAWVDAMQECKGCPFEHSNREDCGRGFCFLEEAAKKLDVHTEAKRIEKAFNM